MPIPSVPRCAVLVAHPGHELVIHEFVSRSHPLVAVLTDGSGNTGESRLDSTTRVLEAAHAQPTSFYGGFTDAQCYAALLSGDADLFIGMAESLADVLVASRIEMVAGDASEGWNPIHDIWRTVLNTAVALTSDRLGRPVRNLEFLLFGSHAAAASSCSSDAIVMRLDEAAYERKLASSSAYSELHAEVAAAINGTTSSIVASPTLSAELDRRLGGLNGDSYRVELLRPAGAAEMSDGPRVYELYGEMMVAAGRYREAIRHDRHLAPIEAALQQHAMRETRSSVSSAAR
ncbi:MAG TPA: hypothetical protein VFN10_13345 [Thermoanaerobaculia bacterium]|nr:hypothetical protein [Thermoanaerobaculia bacterium]